MADNRNITLSIYRYNPEVDAEPYMKDYELAIPAKSDPMLLTLLERLKDSKILLLLIEDPAVKGFVVLMV